MAPLCECGHRASEHHKQMNIRTWCTAIDGNEVSAYEESWDCECLMYRAGEGEVP